MQIERIKVCNLGQDVYKRQVIDCDEPQYNLADLRDEELELIKSSDYFKAQALSLIHILT